MITRYKFLYPLLCLFCYSCATVIPPEGGERDEEPPKVVEEKSTPNFQTNYLPKEIELTFDEWVKLEDWRNQVVVSPPVGRQDYEVKLKGRAVYFTFKEDLELRQDATYTINFGEAIKDLNESNPAEDLRFVFATGDVLDSLSVNSKVIDAKTNEPVENALVLLYENRADTVVRTEKPFYFGKTNEEGVTRIENIRADSFKVAVLVDSDNDYLYNQPEREQFGFLDSLISVSSSPLDTIRLKVFLEEPPLRLNSFETEDYGLVKLVFNRDPYDLDSLFAGVDLELIPEVDKDTLKLWNSYPPENGWKLFVQTDTSGIDTVGVGPFETVEMDSLKLARRLQIKITPFNPAQQIELTFNQPLASWDTSRIIFMADTLLTRIDPTIAIDSVNRRKLSFAYNWKEGRPYQLTLLPGALTSIFNQPHDTIRFDYRADLIKKYGNINLSITGLDTTSQYIIQLREGEKIVQSFIAENTASFGERLRTIKTGKYQVHIITDHNRNGRWDTGDYDLKRQPEPIFIKELEQLRANWDLDVSIGVGSG